MAIEVGTVCGGACGQMDRMRADLTHLVETERELWEQSSDFLKAQLTNAYKDDLAAQRQALEQVKKECEKRGEAESAQRTQDTERCLRELSRLVRALAALEALEHCNRPGRFMPNTTACVTQWEPS